MNPSSTAGRVGLTTYTTPSDTEIVMTRVFDAPRRFVFAAWTDPRHLPHWFGRHGWTLPVCEIDLRPGGAWRFVHRGPDGTDMLLRGIYQEVSPPERLVYTESIGAEGGTETINILVLSEQDERTTLTCTIRYPSRQARDAMLRTNMREGVAEAFDSLAAYLRTIHDEKEPPA